MEEFGPGEAGMRDPCSILSDCDAVLGQFLLQGSLGEGWRKRYREEGCKTQRETKFQIGKE